MLRRPGGQISKEMCHGEGRKAHPLRLCNSCINTRVACLRHAASLLFARGRGPTRTQEAAHAGADHRCGDAAVRRARLSRDDDRRHRRSSGRRAANLLLVFPVEEAVVFHHADRDMDSLATALRNRPAGQNAFDGLRGWIDTMFDEWSAEEDQAVLRKRLCKEDDGLANFAGGMMARIHELLLEAIAEDLGEPQDALRPQLVAAAAMAALSSSTAASTRRPSSARRRRRRRHLPCSTTRWPSCAAVSTRCRTASKPSCAASHRNEALARGVITVWPALAHPAGSCSWSRRTTA